ncbi:hypothetical protein [Amycolatopsis vastitatis]|uniref:hypothetical protein n=1 Tax=Amycolatopsis vastitatis TaxID=1905142 RepID=UPI001F0A2459|nr:hypothetical protein [Amycolatopsis vastitatis]
MHRNASGGGTQILAGHGSGHGHEAVLADSGASLPGVDRLTYGPAGNPPVR